MAVVVRAERPSDVAVVRAIVTRAFKRPNEAHLVDLLRSAGKATISLVAAERDGRVVGHVLFSPVVLDDALFAAGLAPLAVVPEAQHQGIGGALVRAGLERCRATGQAYVVVLGNPKYYGRFGFVAAERHHITCEYAAPLGAFQIVELVPGALAGRGGLVRYAAEFAAV